MLVFFRLKKKKCLKIKENCIIIWWNEEKVIPLHSLLGNKIWRSASSVGRAQHF